MRNILLAVLAIIALAMIVLSFKMSIFPPGLTGLGFLIIAFLFYQKSDG